METRHSVGRAPLNQASRGASALGLFVGAFGHSVNHDDLRGRLIELYSPRSSNQESGGPGSPHLIGKSNAIAAFPNQALVTQVEANQIHASHAHQASRGASALGLFVGTFGNSVNHENSRR